MRLIPPQQEHNALLLCIDGLYDVVCEEFPALFLVGVREAFAHGEHCVEEEDALGGPAGEVAVDGDRGLELDFGVFFQGLNRIIL